MKKAAAAVMAAVMIIFFNIGAHALIQYPPKDPVITAEVTRSDFAPVIDGTVSDGEYAKLSVPATSFSYVVASESDWSRVRDTVISAYAAVCGDDFYLAVEVPMAEEYVKTDCRDRLMWAQTCLLVAAAPKGSAGRSALEFGIRPGDSYVFHLYDGIGFDPEGRYEAVYSDGILTYELSVPMQAFGAEGDDGFLLCFSASVGDFYDGEKTAYIQYGKGISGFSTPDDADAGKDASLFPKVIIKDPDGSSAADETTAQTVAPDTSVDVAAAVVLSVLLMSLSMIVFRLLTRKKVI